MAVALVVAPDGAGDHNGPPLRTINFDRSQRRPTMSFALRMLETFPSTAVADTDTLAACIDACF
ncbi:MAG: hypothetical protein AVDCRST_MAG33-2412, partial [uncultured Thermomicrobiales bacterium]